MPSQKFGVDRPHSANTLARVVPRGAAADRGDDAGGDADHERDRHRQQRELDRHRQLLQRPARAPAAGCAPTRRGRPAARRRPSRRSAPAAARRGGASRAGRRRRSGPAPRRRGSSPGRRAAAAAARRSASTRTPASARSCARRLSEVLEHRADVRRATPQGAGRHLQPGHAQQAVGHAAHAAELGVVGPQPVAVVQVDDRPLLQHPRRDLLVDLLALGRVALACATG